MLIGSGKPLLPGDRRLRPDWCLVHLTLDQRCRCLVILVSLSINLTFTETVSTLSFASSWPVLHGTGPIRKHEKGTTNYVAYQMDFCSSSPDRDCGHCASVSGSDFEGSHYGRVG